jgi:hypothetical protein
VETKVTQAPEEGDTISYVGNSLERLLGKVFNQGSAQHLPIVMPEIQDMLSPIGLSHVECGLTTFYQQRK